MYTSKAYEYRVKGLKIHQLGIQELTIQRIGKGHCFRGSHYRGCKEETAFDICQAGCYPYDPGSKTGLDTICER